MARLNQRLPVQPLSNIARFNRDHRIEQLSQQIAEQQAMLNQQAQEIKRLEIQLAELLHKDAA